MQDKDALDFVRTQQAAYGFAGALLILSFVVLGILNLFGITEAQIIAWLVDVGVLVAKK